ncbi:MAG: enoyl-CoA hydratase [Actinobacteria bacterium]|nr:enoyl-CoA hydratase [Actinomycetota bacterium]
MDTGCDQLHATVDADGVGVIVFDNPAKHNAMTADMLAALGRVRRAFAADPAVRVVVVTGAGDRAFISGADIAQLGGGTLPTPAAAPAPASAPADPTPGGALDVGRPVLAMIRGYCIGGGLMIALAADVRICSEDASFGIPAAKLGVGYPHEATTTLVALVGPGQAAEILYSGRRIDAREAERIGLVNRVVPPDALEDTVFALAREIASNAPLSHVAHQRSIRAAVSGRPGDRAAVDAAVQAAWTSADFREGAAAFLERRPPTFTGR